MFRSPCFSRLHGFSNHRELHGAIFSNGQFRTWTELIPLLHSEKWSEVIFFYFCAQCKAHVVDFNVVSFRNLTRTQEPCMGHTRWKDFIPVSQVFWRNKCWVSGKKNSSFAGWGPILTNPPQHLWIRWRMLLHVQFCLHEIYWRAKTAARKADVCVCGLNCSFCPIDLTSAPQHRFLWCFLSLLCIRKILLFPNKWPRQYLLSQG